MTDYVLNAVAGSFNVIGDIAGANTASILTEGLPVSSALVSIWNLTITSGPIIAPSTAYLFLPGAQVVETPKIADVSAQTMKYLMAPYEGLVASDHPQLGWALGLTSSFTLADLQVVQRGMMILEALKITDAIVSTAKYGVVLTNTLKVADLLERFLSGTWTDGVTIASQVLPHWAFNALNTDGIALRDVLVNQLFMRVTLADGAVLDDAELLQAIYSGTLADGVVVHAAYVSPDGTFTTWAINTRTGAVTEYQNFAFNSMAQMGRKYLGASSTGLYELDGETDSGDVNIPTHMIGGSMQPGGSHFTSFKAIYLGMKAKTDAPRSAPDFIFKLVAGDGRQYVYGVRPQDAQTTRIMLGKGLRARYFSWEMMSLGPDFDLDQIEFVPLISARRI